MNHPRHELNRGFDWRPIRSPFRRLSPAQAELYNAQGWFAFEDAFPPDEVERLIAEIDPFERETEAFLAEQEGGRAFIGRAGELTFSAHLVARSERLRDFVRSAPLREIASDVLGPDVRLYWDQAVYKKPGDRRGFPWHQDNGYTFIEPQQYLTCWIALTEADERNGCPQVAPGLHRQGTLAHEPSELGFRCLPDDFPGVPVPLRPGSVAVFSSLTPHRTGPNVGGDVRKAYIVQFAPDGADWLMPDGSGGIRRTPANAPERQFHVVRGGRPVREG